VSACDLAELMILAGVVLVGGLIVLVVLMVLGRRN
jgi:hypothetical protein